MAVDDEPYRGVDALFNADLHAGLPQWAPREHWVISTAHSILFTAEDRSRRDAATRARTGACTSRRKPTARTESEEGTRVPNENEHRLDTSSRGTVRARST